MPASQILTALLQRASAEGSRSTALKPLGWLLAILVPATLVSFYLKLPPIVGISGIVASALALMVYLGSYIYLLMANPDALRSERYSLKKMELEKGIYGDSLTGEIENQSYSQEQISTDNNSNGSGGNE